MQFLPPLQPSSLKSIILLLLIIADLFLFLFFFFFFFFFFLVGLGGVRRGGVEGMDSSVQMKYPEEESTEAALTLQKFYKSYRTRRKLADSAVVLELWWQAGEYARLNYNTISFFNYLEHESVSHRWNRVSFNASKVGKGLSEDAKAKKLAFQHWIEAIDPRHRYGRNLNFYHNEWCKGSSGQPFFYWLDIGAGKGVNLEECPRTQLQQQCVTYLGPKEREHHEYVVEGGMLLHKKTKEPMDTTKRSPEGTWIFVMSTSKKLYVGEKKRGMFHHSSFLAGGSTLAAGRLVAVEGLLKTISAYSGHYRPTAENLKTLLDILSENGVNLDEVQITSSPNENEKDEIHELDLQKNANGITAEPKPPSLEIYNGMENNQPPAQREVTQADIRGNRYKKTLSGGVPSPRTHVPKKVVMKRINSKNATTSYQLGHQLSTKWSTGAGPRIGCLVDYPSNLREEALEFLQLSPNHCTPP